jgi:hypothetical protein
MSFHFHADQIDYDWPHAPGCMTGSQGPSHLLEDASGILDHVDSDMAGAVISIGDGMFQD